MTDPVFSSPKAEAAYRIAERVIEQAIAEGWEELDFGPAADNHLKNLHALPPRLADCDTLKILWI